MVHGTLVTLRRKGYQGRSPWLVSKLLVLTQTMFQFLNQLRKPRRSRRIGRPYQESAALFQLPFELFSVRLSIHDGTLFICKTNRSTTETACHLEIFPRLTIEIHLESTAIGCNRPGSRHRREGRSLGMDADALRPPFSSPCFDASNRAAKSET